MSQAFLPAGSILQYGDGGSPESFTPIIEVKGTTKIPRKRADVDVSNQDSVNLTKEYIPGWKDTGVISFQGNFVPSDPSQDFDTGFASLFESGRVANWQLILPDTAGTTIVFAGYVNSHDISLPLEKEAMFDGAVRVSGPVTIA